MAKKEIERRFLAGTLPWRILAFPSSMITQYYVRLPSGRTRRYRQEDDKYYRVEKSGKGLVRDEPTVKITEREYLHNRDRMIGSTVVKRRFRIPAGQLTYELDVYCLQLDGLVMIEVEFRSVRQAKAFRPPSYFGREVTYDSAFSGSSLAQKGKPI